MNIFKAFLATIIYIITIELLASWIFIAKIIKIENYEECFFLVQGTFQLLAVLLYLYIIKRKTFTYGSIIKHTQCKWYLVAIIMGSSFVFIQTPLNVVYNYLFDDIHSISYNFDGLKQFQSINILSSILFVPIAEESFFRGYIQKNLQIKTNKTVAIITASLLFAFIHIPFLRILISEYYEGDLHLFYITIFGGLLSGILFYKSKSIGPSIMYHITWNIMAIAM